MELPDFELNEAQQQAVADYMETAADAVALLSTRLEQLGLDRNQSALVSSDEAMRNGAFAWAALRWQMGHDAQLSAYLGAAADIFNESREAMDQTSAFLDQENARLGRGDETEEEEMEANRDPARRDLRMAQDKAFLEHTDLELVHLKEQPWLATATGDRRFGHVAMADLRAAVAAGRPIVVQIKDGAGSTESFPDLATMVKTWSID